MGKEGVGKEAGGVGGLEVGRAVVFEVERGVIKNLDNNMKSIIVRFYYTCYQLYLLL